MNGRYIEADGPLEAWEQTASVLLEVPGHRLPNVAVRMRRPTLVAPGSLNRIDASVRSAGRLSTEQVARTIMPISVAQASDWQTAAARLLPRLGHRSYFVRLADFNGDGKVNQIARAIDELRRPRRYVDPAPLLLERSPDARASAHIGFPCLSAIQLHQQQGTLHASAMYRSHHYHDKALGNFVGLGRLMHLIAKESGLQVGELFVLSTDATLKDIRRVDSYLN